VVDRVGVVERPTEPGHPLSPVIGLFAAARDRPPAIERFVRANADEADCRLTARVPLTEGRHELLELHAGAEEGKIVMVSDAARVRLANPIGLAARLPAAPLRLELTDRVAEIERQRDP